MAYQLRLIQRASTIEKARAAALSARPLQCEIRNTRGLQPQPFIGAGQEVLHGTSSRFSTLPCTSETVSR